MVAVDAASRALTQLKLAASLAVRHDAYLIGLHSSFPANGLPNLGYFERFHRPLLEPIYREFAAQTRAEAELARQNFEQIARRQGLSAEWRSVEGYPTGMTALHGRYADLILVGQPAPDDFEAALFRPVPQEVALTSGRPVLIIPYTGTWDEIGRHVLVGWNASREATRAVNDAIPLLADADSVTVLTIDPDEGPAEHGEVPGADIALHLARHGVKVATEATVSGGMDVGNVLLSRANDLAVDLLVMGAYGHSRFRELVLGGATRTVLESMTVPILMTH